MNNSINNISLKFLALAGAEEIGMNMSLYLYENNGEKYSILVDCGVGFINLPGVHISVPNLQVLEKMNVKPDALVITHGHEDHIGAIPHLIEKLNCPIYATAFTAGLIKAKLEYNNRKTNYKMHVVEMNDVLNLGPFKIKYIRATHSIPDNAMLGIEVANVRILHTGDWKDDTAPVIGQVSDFDAIKEFSKTQVDYLVSDSTNINEFEASISEEEVGTSLLSIMQNMSNDKHTAKGKFILTCFSSNIARVKSIIDAARICNRKVLVLGSSLKKTCEIAVGLNYIKSDLFVSEEEAVNIPSNKLAIVTTGSQAEENSALWKMANQLRSAGSVLNSGDVLVFSARVIDGRQSDVRKVINQLIEKGVKVIHPWNTHSLIHASGHPTRPDVKKLLEIVKPTTVIPVHCEAEHRHAHINFVREMGHKAYNLHNNVLIELGKDNVTKIESYSNTVQALVLDGNRLISGSNKIFNKRKEMNENGFIMISIKFVKKKFFTIITNYGLFEEDEKSTIAFNQNLKKQIDLLINAVAEADQHSKNYALKNQVIINIRKYIKETMGKVPLVGIHFL